MLESPPVSTHQAKALSERPDTEANISQTESPRIPRGKVDESVSRRVEETVTHLSSSSDLSIPPPADTFARSGEQSTTSSNLPLPGPTSPSERGAPFRGTTAQGGEPSAIGSQAIPPGGLQMAQGTSGIAAVLRANIRTEELSEQPPQSLGGIEPALMPAAIERVEPVGARSPHFYPDGPIKPDLKAQFDIDELMEKLADGLEFEFIRTYGTSGR